MAITDGTVHNNCGKCKNWSIINGPCGRCSKHYLPFPDSINPEQNENCITLDTWLCENFEE